MAVLTYPTLSRTPSSLQWGLMDNTDVHESPFNKVVQTLYRPGTRWTASITYEELKHADASLIEAFIAELQGRSGRFYLPDYSRLTPRGVGGGSPVLSVAAVAGDSSIQTSGWPVSTNGLLLSADRVNIGDNFFMVLGDVNSDAGGLATISIRPALNVGAAISSPLVVTNAACRMMLDSNSVVWRTDPPNLKTVRFTCKEAHT